MGNYEHKRKVEYKFNITGKQIIVILGLLAVLVTLGPFVIRAAIVMDTGEVKMVVWVLMTILLLVVVLGFMLGGWWVFSRSMLKHQEQDDADENRKFALQWMKEADKANRRLAVMARQVEDQSHRPAVQVQTPPAEGLPWPQRAALPEFVDTTAVEME